MCSWDETKGRFEQQDIEKFFAIFELLKQTKMKTLNISISDLEFNKFGLRNDKLTFSDFVDIVSKELTRQTLNKCVELAEKYGLSKMTMGDITKEVKAARRDAKNRS